MSAIDIGELQKTVFARHGMMMPMQDPVLLTVTVSEIVLERYVKLVAKQIEEQPPVLAKALESSLARAQELSEKIVTGASDYVAETVKLAVRDASDDLRKAVDASLAAATAAEQKANAMASASDFAQKAAWYAAAVAGSTAFMSGAALLWSIMHMGTGA